MLKRIGKECYIEKLVRCSGQSLSRNTKDIFLFNWLSIRNIFLVLVRSKFIPKRFTVIKLINLRHLWTAYRRLLIDWQLITFTHALIMVTLQHINILCSAWMNSLQNSQSNLEINNVCRVWQLIQCKCCFCYSVDLFHLIQITKFRFLKSANGLHWMKDREQDNGGLGENRWPIAGKTGEIWEVTGANRAEWES